jgi:cation diffusion facilitator family transporter
LKTASQNFKIQKYIAIISVVLFFLKVFAWYLTNSVAILTDALESVVNVIAGFIGLYSLYVSAKPKDKDHPYGHGKAEFISAAIEGVLIASAGVLVIREAFLNLSHPHKIQKLDYGMGLIVVTALINYIAGYICVKTGKKNNSLALIASGKHLIADTYTTIGITIGLAFLYFTKIAWIDSAVAIIFAIVILFTGYKIVRSSVAGMMDEADNELLEKMVQLLNKNRSENWVDLHNLRIIKYGAMIHLDCHLTVPWYFNVHQAHDEIDRLSSLVRTHFGDSVELFVHSDGCLDFSCAICDKNDCNERRHNFKQKVTWTMENISFDKKHQIGTK